MAGVAPEPTLSEEGGWTVLLHFEMEAPEHQHEFLDAYRPVVEEFASHWPGFLGATLYASTDGTRVTNHTRWADEAAYLDYLKRSDPAPRLRAIEAALANIPGIRGPRMDVPHTYRAAVDVPPAAGPAVAR